MCLRAYLCKTFDASCMHKYIYISMCVYMCMYMYMYMYMYGSQVICYVRTLPICLSVLQVEESQCSKREIKLLQQEVVISSLLLAKACASINRIKILVSPGQTMNISAWNFADGRTQSYGKLHDLIANNVAEIAPVARHDHVFSSVGNQVELELYERLDVIEQPLLMSIQGKNISD